jgi:hypothetical protein
LTEIFLSLRQILMDCCIVFIIFCQQHCASYFRSKLLTKRTITSHLNSLNTKKTMKYDVGNPGPGLGHAQKYGGVEPVNGIPTTPPLITGSPLVVVWHLSFGVSMFSFHPRFITNSCSSALLIWSWYSTIHLILKFFLC